MDLSNNTILITGGASGIGLALAKLLHANNNKIIVCGRNKARLNELEKQLTNVSSYQCDLADEADLARFADTVLANHPGLNMLFNNAGVQCNYLFTEEPSHLESIREEVSINLLAPIRLTDKLLPHLMSQDNAAIVNVTSALVFAPKRRAAVYCATKSALRSFTQALRYQLEGSCVAVFELIPSLVETEMTKGRGKGKLSPQALANKVFKAMEKDKHEMLIEKTKILYLLYRLFPSIAYRILKHS